MKKKILFLVIIILVLLLISVVINYFFHNRISKMPTKYCYETYFGYPNSVLIIEDISYKDSLINYYLKMEKGDTPTFNFPLKTLPQNDPIYIVCFTNDSLLAEFISYYDRGKSNGGSYLRGYVYAKTLHDFPPPKKK